MKAKPTKWAVKLFVLADTRNGYNTDFTIYTGKSRFISGQGLSHLAVSSLMDESLLGRGYHLYVGNFYSSPKLVRDLYAKSFVAYATFHDSRRNVTKNKIKCTDNTEPQGLDPMDLRVETVVCQVGGHERSVIVLYHTPGL